MKSVFSEMKDLKESMTVHNWLKDRIEEMDQYDCVDYAHNAHKLAELAKRRMDYYLGRG